MTHTNNTPITAADAAAAEVFNQMQEVLKDARAAAEALTNALCATTVGSAFAAKNKAAAAAGGAKYSAFMAVEYLKDIARAAGANNGLYKAAAFKASRAIKAAERAAEDAAAAADYFEYIKTFTK